MTAVGQRSKKVIAVGTLIAERPPPRSVRAAFPHTAPTLGNDGSTIRMHPNVWYTYAGAVSDARVTLNCIPLGPRPSLHQLSQYSPLVGTPIMQP